MRLSFEKFMDGINDQRNAATLPQYPYVFVYDADKGINVKQRKTYHPEFGWETTEEDTHFLNVCKTLYETFEYLDVAKIIPMMSAPTMYNSYTAGIALYAARSYIKGVSSD